jgi:hypothetical protein
MSSFKQIPSSEPIADVIKSAFDAVLPVEGGWGYDKHEATVFYDNPQQLPVEQLEHMLISMRAYLEMNMTLPKEARYGSINVNEKLRETVTEENHIYHKVVYEISAMKEEDYERFIEAYKEGYGKEMFDVDAHFRQRKAATLLRSVMYWFEVSKIV